MLTKLAIWYLDKTKTSVLMGYEIENGYVKSLNNKATVSGNKMTNVDYRTCDNEPLLIPEGKFSIERSNK